MKKVTLPALIAFFILFLLFPLGKLLIGSFYVERLVDGQLITEFSFAYYAQIFSNPFYLECFSNSFIIATTATLITLALCLPMANGFLRFDFPGKALFTSLMLVPLILPPFVGAIGLKQFFARFGSLNQILFSCGLADPQAPPDWLGSGGFLGIITLQVLHLYPIMFLSIQAALANVDPTLRDAARNMGASDWRIFRTVTVPLAMPGIFAGCSIVFVSAFTDLGTPLMFEFQTTVPTQIFNLVTQVDNPLGYALVVITLVLVSLLFLVAKWFGHGDYAMMGRAATHSQTRQLRGWSGWGITAGLTILIAISLLPHIGVIIQSFSARWFMTVLPSEYSAAYYGEVFTLDVTSVSITNSLFYATLSALVDVVLGITIAYLLVREKFVGRTLLDVLSMLPLALPGLVLAFAYFITFSQPLLPGEDGISSWINGIWLALLDPSENPTMLLVIAYAIQRLPYIVRAAHAGLQQTSVSLEEASINLGASRWATIWRVTLPLVSANLIAGTILTFSFAMLDVSNGLMLAQESSFYPVTKAIYALMGRITPTAPSVASALGVLSMILLAVGLFFAARLLGQKMGALFRA